MNYITFQDKNKLKDLRADPPGEASRTGLGFLSVCHPLSWSGPHPSHATDVAAACRLNITMVGNLS